MAVAGIATEPRGGNWRGPEHGRLVAQAVDDPDRRLGSPPFLPPLHSGPRNSRRQFRPAAPGAPKANDLAEFDHARCGVRFFTNTSKSLLSGLARVQDPGAVITIEPSLPDDPQDSPNVLFTELYENGEMIQSNGNWPHEDEDVIDLFFEVREEVFGFEPQDEEPQLPDRSSSGGSRGGNSRSNRGGSGRSSSSGQNRSSDGGARSSNRRQSNRRQSPQDDEMLA